MNFFFGTKPWINEHFFYQIYDIEELTERDTVLQLSIQNHELQIS